MTILARSGMARADLARYFLYYDIADYKSALGGMIGLPLADWPDLGAAKAEYRKCLSAAAVIFEDPTGEASSDMRDEAIMYHEMAFAEWRRAGELRNAAVEMGHIALLFQERDPPWTRDEALAHIAEAAHHLKQWPDDSARLAHIAGLVWVKSAESGSDLLKSAELFSAAANTLFAVSEPFAPPDARPRDIAIDLQVSLLMYAEVVDALGDRKSSLDALRQAADVAESRVLATLSHRGQLAILNQSTNLYQQLMLTYLALEGSLEERGRYAMEAWKVIGRFKGRMTAAWYESALRRVGADDTPGRALPELVDELRGLRARIEDLRERRGEAETVYPDGTVWVSPTKQEEGEDGLIRMLELSSELRRIVARAREIEDEIDDALPILRSPPVLDVKLLLASMALLPSPTVLLDLYVIADRVIVAVIVADLRPSLVVAEADPDTFRRYADVFATDEVFDGARAEDALRWLAATLREVVDALCEPEMCDESGDEERRPQLAIVPSGALHRWPLCALPTPDGRRLIDLYACTTLPSAASLPVAIPTRLRPRRGYIGLAPQSIESQLGFGIGQICAEANRLSGEAHTGPEATRAQLEKGGAVLSVVTHGRFDVDTPEASFIELSDGEGGIDRLQAIDVLAAANKARWSIILLWACSLHGGVHLSENWFALSGAVVMAAPTVLLTLCPVQEAAAAALSAALMTELWNEELTIAQNFRLCVQALRKADAATVQAWGRAIAESLGEADRIEFMRRWEVWLLPREEAEPFASVSTWAPFFLVGGLTSFDTNLVRSAIMD